MTTLPRTNPSLSQADSDYIFSYKHLQPNPKPARRTVRDLGTNCQKQPNTSHASRQLKENEKNYSPFLLETSAAVWGMDNFNEYLKV